MRRATTLSLVAFALVALAGAAAGGRLAVRHVERFGTVVQPARPAVNIPAGREACQAPLVPHSDFSGVQLLVATYRQPGPPLSVTVRDVATGDVLGRGNLAGGYPDNSFQTIATGPVPGRRNVAICVANDGSSSALLYGDAGHVVAETGATIGGRPVDADIGFVFTRDRPFAGLVADIARRAALFRPQWVGPWTFWLLAAGVVLAVPLLLAGALRGAVRDEDASESAQPLRVLPDEARDPAPVPERAPR